MSFKMSHSKPKPMPMPIAADSTCTTDKAGPLNDNDHSTYRSLVRSILYAAVFTRPYIAFAARVLARKAHAPSVRHLNLAKRLVRHLSGTATEALFYRRSDGPTETLTGYSDSHWAGCKDTRESNSGFLVTITSAPVFWLSKSQTIVSLSSAEAEYVSMSHCALQFLSLRGFFYEFITHSPCTSEPPLPPTTIRTENTASMSLALTNRSPRVKSTFPSVLIMYAS